MRSTSRAVVVLAVAFALAMQPAAAPGAGPFDVGITDPAEPGFGELDVPGAYDAARAANVRVVRIPAAWSVIARRRPSDPANHADPAYDWSGMDARVNAIAGRGMEPLLSLYAAPGWAKTTREYGGQPRPTPKPEDFAAFVTAAARRYSGATAGVGRVRYYQLWNEPNLKTYLDPVDAVEQYRAMVKAAYPAVHAAATGNRVVAGGLAPYAAFKEDIAPLRFMRELLCMSAGSRPRPTCETTVPFDIWSTHPYTNGGPNRSARARDDVSLGDLPEMRRLLRAAERAGHVDPARRSSTMDDEDFWVTEFSWDTKGPDPGGVPLSRHARWVAEAFYNVWRNDVSLLVWFQLRDNPKGTFSWGQTWQSGLFFRTTEKYADEKAKPVRGVVRFPFVALPARRGSLVWGRTPKAGKGRVAIERRSGRRWVRVTTVRANSHGVFRRTLRGNRGATLRARLGSEAAVPFKVERTRDRQVRPFGGP
jgi:hypothetical protein